MSPLARLMATILHAAFARTRVVNVFADDVSIGESDRTSRSSILRHDKLGLRWTKLWLERCHQACKRLRPRVCRDDD